MGPFLGIATLLIVSQVPAPEAVEHQARELREAYHALHQHEADELAQLADRLDRSGQPDDAARAREAIEPHPTHPEASRFVPRPSIVPPPAGEGLANIPAVGAPSRDHPIVPIRTATAEALFDLAEQAAAAHRYSLADACLRGVLARQPDHAEARRLLGYVPHEGGWAIPFAVRLLREGYVDHPVFGWVPADWVPHLDRGELPAPSVRGRPRQWLPADRANALRRDWERAWEITTAHFRIRANVPLDEAIAFAHRLEAFHDLFFALMADVLGPAHSLLAQRFRDPGRTATDNPRKHDVFYFATKDQYVNHLLAREGPDIARSLGIYLPGRNRNEPGRSYFFKDEDGELAVEATLYHEASHQLLFEAAGPSQYQNNQGHFWVFEGLGTYFETVEVQPDGALEVGGLVGPRIALARERLIDNDEFIPIERFVIMGRDRFNGAGGGDIYLHYAQAMALTVFLMQADAGRFREPFLDYVQDAYRGRFRRGSGRGFAESLGVPSEELGARFLEFLGTSSAGGAR